MITSLHVSTIRRAARNAGLSTIGVAEGLISLAWFNRIKFSAKARNLDFALTLQDLALLWRQQEGRCALTGVRLTPRRKPNGRNVGNASLDRIDSAQGYIKSNVQFTTKQINICKQGLTQDEFITMCQQVFEHSQEKQN